MTLIRHLRQCPFQRSQGVFNPWQETDECHDGSAAAARIRRRQLRHYLITRQDRARFCLIGEALSYQGGHFSGIAMTSERILLGYKIHDGIRPEDVLPGMKPCRTSRPDLKSKGFTENTASIVWKTLKELSDRPTDYVLWNVFPWHPFDPRRGLLSNRLPTLKEIDVGTELLNEFICLFPNAAVFAVGKIASRSLTRLGIPHNVLRHPSMAGANTFRRQLKAAVKRP